MPELQANCWNQGTLTLNSSAQMSRGFSTSGSLAAYGFTSAEKLFNTAKSFQFIERPNGSKIKGSEYTLRKAKNDFSYAK